MLALDSASPDEQWGGGAWGRSGAAPPQSGLTLVPGEVNCIFTKGLIPFVEKEVGAEGVAAICRVAGRSRDYLMADHNWIPLPIADEVVRVVQRLMNEPDEERWARRFGESFMDWKPREERSYLGTYSMGIGHPRAAYERMPTIYHSQSRFYRVEALEVGRRRARYQWTPLPGYRMPLWACTWLKVQNERFPTNWGLPRARITESTCAGRGADACRWEVRWKNPSLGRHFWLPSLVGAAGSVALGVVDAVGGGGWLLAVATPLPLVAGMALGYSLREGRRRRHVQRLLDLQSEEIIYSNRELEKKFAELETRIEQLSTADRPERGGERHARSREDLRPDAHPARAPHGVPARAALPGGPRAARAARRSRIRAPSRHQLFEASSSRSTRRRARPGAPRSPARRCWSTTWTRRRSRSTGTSCAPTRSRASSRHRCAYETACSACSRSNT